MLDLVTSTQGAAYYVPNYVMEQADPNPHPDSNPNLNPNPNPNPNPNQAGSCSRTTARCTG